MKGVRVSERLMDTGGKPDECFIGAVRRFCFGELGAWFVHVSRTEGCSPKLPSLQPFLASVKHTSGQLCEDSEVRTGPGACRFLMCTLCNCDT